MSAELWANPRLSYDLSALLHCDQTLTTTPRLAYDIESVVDFMATEGFIPELLALESGATVPADILTRYSAEEIALSLVERLRRTRDRLSNDPTSYYDFRNDTQLQMVFPDAVLEKIVANGFLNSHQINRGKTDPVYASACMECVELRMLGVTFPSGSPELREKIMAILPKYAYLGMQRPDPAVWNTRHDTRYGNVVAVFKPHVKDRVTFTPGNSYLIPENAHTLDYRTNTPLPEPDYVGQGLTDRPEWGHHWEAQVWGTLTLADVEYFMVDCPKLGASATDRIAALQQTQIPVFKCAQDPTTARMSQGAPLP